MDKLFKYNFFREKLTNKINNDEYAKYYKAGLKSNNRAGMVAWTVPRSQMKNFDLVSNYINNNDSILDYGCGLGDFTEYLSQKSIDVDYLGVDINPSFIENASKTYPNKKFNLIDNIDDVKEKFDKCIAIGVFTWFITKEDFIKTILGLYERCSDEILMTFLYTPITEYDERFWQQKYRRWNPIIFQDLFPNMKIKHEVKTDDTLLIRIIK